MSKPHCSASRSALAGGREARLLFNEALTVNRGKSLHESEDKSITETRKQRQTKNDRFSRKHDKRPAGRLDHLVQGEPLLKSLNFVRTIDVVLACFTTTLGFSIEEDGSSRFGDDKEVEDLNETAKDELSPANPSPSFRISTQQMVPRKNPYQSRLAAIKGPTIGPITLPYYGCQFLWHYGSEWQILTPTEEKTINATAHCCSFGS